jgi:hypothetical protein
VHICGVSSQDNRTCPATAGPFSPCLWDIILETKWENNVKLYHNLESDRNDEFQWTFVSITWNFFEKTLVFVDFSINRLPLDKTLIRITVLYTYTVIWYALVLYNCTHVYSYTILDHNHEYKTHDDVEDDDTAFCPLVSFSLYTQSSSKEFQILFFSDIKGNCHSTSINLNDLKQL